MTEFFIGILDLIRWSNAWRYELQIAWTLALLFSAFIWGGAPEKIVISIWLFVAQTQLILNGLLDRQTIPETWSGVNEVAFVGDCILLIGFVILALQANRRYPLWIAALQVIALMAHGVRFYAEDVTLFVYALLVAGTGWVQIFIMTGGLIAYVRRERGVYPDWRWQVGRAAPGSATAEQAFS